MNLRGASVVRRKSLYFDCHSGLDPESSLAWLDSRQSLPSTPIGGGNDGSGMSVKKRWTHYTSCDIPNEEYTRPLILDQ